MINNSLWVILGLTFFLRCPFFFASSIDWDESTFILMGQSILDGNLPYIELWDNKPPLLFFIFAVILAISNKSIIVIRIIGSVFVAFSAFFIYKTGKYLDNKSTGLIAAILFIIMTGDLGGKVVMSEIIAALPLTYAFWLMISQKKDHFTYFLVGFLLSIATLIRLNLAYLDLAIFFYYLLEKSKIKYLFSFLSGLLVLLILIIIPYLVSNNLGILYQSVVEAPLNYSRSQDLSKGEIILYFITLFLKGNLLLFLFLVGFLAGVMIVISKIILSYNNSKNLILLLLWLVAITYSIASSGHTYPHYLIQVLPWMVISKAIFLTSPLVSKLRYILLVFFSIGLLDAARPIFTEYIVIFNKLEKGIDLQSDQGYQVANFLKKANPNKATIYMMDFHIVHWLTQTKPITKMVTHPSNIGREELLKTVLGKDATPVSEMKKIFKRNPLFIVKMKETPYLDSQPEAKNLLLMTLKEKYKLVTKMGDLYIYKQK